MQTDQILTALGLSANEVKIYLAILDLGMAPMSVIARKAALQRPTTYGVVKKLRKRGLTECFLSKGIRLYSVLPPASLYKRYADYLEEFKKALPTMEAKHERLLFKPRVGFYEGKKELQKLYAECFTPKSELLAYLLPQHAAQYFSPTLHQSFLKDYAQNKKRVCRIISTDTSAAHTALKILQGAKTDIRFLTPKKALSQEIFLFDQHVCIFSFVEGYALKLTSADAFGTQRALFEMVWKTA